MRLTVQTRHFGDAGIYADWRGSTRREVVGEMRKRHLADDRSRRSLICFDVGFSDA